MCLVYLCYAQESLLLFVTWSFCLTFTITSVFLPYFYFTSRIYYFYSNYFFWSPKILTFTFVTSAMSYFYFCYFFWCLSTFTFTSVTFFKIIKLYFLLWSILFPTSDHLVLRLSQPAVPIPLHWCCLWDSFHIQRNQRNFSLDLDR